MIVRWRLVGWVWEWVTVVQTKEAITSRVLRLVWGRALSCCSKTLDMSRWGRTLLSLAFSLRKVSMYIWVDGGTFRHKIYQYDSFNVPKHSRHNFSSWTLTFEFLDSWGRGVAPFHRWSFRLRFIVMNPGLIYCHYTAEKSFVTFVTLNKLRTSFKTGLLVKIQKLPRNPFGTTFAKPSSLTIFTALPWLTPTHSAMSSIVILRSSLINFSTSSLFPGLTAEDGLPLRRLSWRQLKLGSSSSSLILDTHFFTVL